MNKKETLEETSEVSRRTALAALGAVAAGAVLPKEAHADDSGVTRQDVGKVSFEIANYKGQADKFERVPNKSNVVDANSTDDTYATAKSVYEYIKGKESYQQETTDEGKSLFVGTDGNTTLKTYTVDDKLKEDSANPVQGKVLYEEITNLKNSVGLDEKPTKHDTSSDGVTKDLKYVCKSNGYWVTYQEAQDAPSSLSECEMGPNYIYNSNTVSSSDEKWALKRIDGAYVALCEGEFGGLYCGARADTVNWKTPEVIWHS